MRTRAPRTVLQAMLFAAGLALAAGQAFASLPAPTPAQQQAAAAKKAKDEAQAAKDKQALADRVDAVAAHWRTRAATQGWKSHPPVAIAAAAPVPAPGAAPAAGGAPAVAGAPAGATTAGAGAGAPAAAGAAAAPAGTAGAASLSPNPPIRSEKLGTAPPSTDVKAHPTQAQPANAPPAVVKGTPKVKNK